MEWNEHRCFHTWRIIDQIMNSNIITLDKNKYGIFPALDKQIFM